MGGVKGLFGDEGTYRLSAKELDRGDWGLRGNHTCAHRVEKGVHYDRLHGGGNDDAHRSDCFSIAWLWADAEKAVSVDVRLLKATPDRKRKAVWTDGVSGAAGLEPWRLCVPCRAAVEG